VSALSLLSSIVRGRDLIELHRTDLHPISPLGRVTSVAMLRWRKHYGVRSQHVAAAAAAGSSKGSKHAARHASKGLSQFHSIPVHSAGIGTGPRSTSSGARSRLAVSSLPQGEAGKVFHRTGTGSRTQEPVPRGRSRVASEDRDASRIASMSFAKRSATQINHALARFDLSNTRGRSTSMNLKDHVSRSRIPFAHSSSQSKASEDNPSRSYNLSGMSIA